MREPATKKKTSALFFWTEIDQANVVKSGIVIQQDQGKKTMNFTRAPMSSSSVRLHSK